MNNANVFSNILTTMFSLSLLLPAGTLQAETPPGAETIVDRIEASYQQLADYESRFLQVVRFKDFDTPFTSQGTLYLKHGMMRWDYQEPSQQQIFVNADQVLYYVPEHKQVIKSTLLAEVDSPIPLQLLSGTARLGENFTAVLETTEGPAYRLQLHPKEKTLRVSQIQIDVSPSTYLIQRIVLHEANGNRSIFEFSESKTNRGLQDGLFSFQIPKGVVVVESPPIR